VTLIISQLLKLSLLQALLIYKFPGGSLISFQEKSMIATPSS
jgi:hypothetical protein